MDLSPVIEEEFRELAQPNWARGVDEKEGFDFFSSFDQEPRGVVSESAARRPPADPVWAFVMYGQFMATIATSSWTRGMCMYDVADPDPSGNRNMVFVFGPMVP